MSITLITESPGDLAAVIDIAGAESWQDPNHKFHKFRSKALLRMKKTIRRYKEDPSPENSKEAEKGFKFFSESLPELQIKRGEGAMWFGHRRHYREKRLFLRHGSNNSSSYI